MTATPTPDEALRDALEARMAELQARFPVGSRWLDEQDRTVTVTGWDARPDASWPIWTHGGRGHYRTDELRPVPPPPVKVRDWQWVNVNKGGWVWGGGQDGGPCRQRAADDPKWVAARFCVVDGHLVLCHPDPDANGDPIPMTVEAWEGE